MTAALRPTAGNLPPHPTSGAHGIDLRNGTRGLFIGGNLRVVVLIPFHTEHEAMAAANDTEYGLISDVYTRDLKRGLNVAGRVESGMVGLNRGPASDPAAPFGGVKHSGIGREGNAHGVLEFLAAEDIATSF